MKQETTGNKRRPGKRAFTGSMATWGQDTLHKFSKNLVKSIGEARDHAEGRASSARVHVVEMPDVRAIRRASCIYNRCIHQDIFP
jgi:hypothetical protein